MNGYIYVATNEVNGKRYVGQTRLTVEQEWRSHQRKASSGNNNCRLLYRALRKHGTSSFFVECVEEVCPATQEELDALERRWIALLGTMVTGYNIREGGSRGRHHPETVERIRAATRGRVVTEATRHKLRAARRLRVVSQETKDKTSTTMKRHAQTPEHKAKVQTAKIGHVVSPETRAKIGAANRIHAIARGWAVRP